jgi:hypothetical protein
MIDRGQVDGVTVDGLGVALFADWPGAIHEGGGRAACYVDERVTPSQRTALSNLLHGEHGGPWGLFRKTYDLAGPEPARFDVSLAQHATRAKVGNVVELEFQAVRNPEGLVLKHANLAASKVFRVRGGVEYDHSGQYAAFGAFAYS